jgi:hypothetical protein
MGIECDQTNNAYLPHHFAHGDFNLACGRVRLGEAVHVDFSAVASMAQDVMAIKAAGIFGGKKSHARLFRRGSRKRLSRNRKATGANTPGADAVKNDDVDATASESKVGASSAGGPCAPDSGARLQALIIAATDRSPRAAEALKTLPTPSEQMTMLAVRVQEARTRALVRRHTTKWRETARKRSQSVAGADADVDAPSLPAEATVGKEPS